MKFKEGDIVVLESSMATSPRCVQAVRDCKPQFSWYSDQEIRLDEDTVFVNACNYTLYDANVAAEIKAKKATAAKKRTQEKATAAAATAAAAEKEKVWDEALKTGFGIQWRVTRSQKTAVGEPTETFWKFWKSDKQAAIRSMGIKFSKYSYGWEVEIPTAGDEYYRDHIMFGSHKIMFNQLEKAAPEKKDEESIDRSLDAMERGLHSSELADDLRAETADEYDARRDFEEDGIGEVGRI